MATTKPISKHQHNFTTLNILITILALLLILKPKDNVKHVHNHQINEFYFARSAILQFISNSEILLKFLYLRYYPVRCSVESYNFIIIKDVSGLEKRILIDDR